MNNRIGVICEIIILVFNVLIFMQLTVLKKDNFVTRSIMYICSFLSLLAFGICALGKILPEVLASSICVTIPTFIVYFLLSKYKDLRFFVTFCFLDTVSFVVALFSRAIGVYLGSTYEIISTAVIFVSLVVIFFKGMPYFKRYRELMENVNDGWAAMAISTFLIYALLIFSAAYPKPLVQRLEYMPVYVFLSVTILSFYIVFILSLLQKKKLSDLNIQLINEKRWYKIAYYDGLTGLKNRMAYMEKINQLEREKSKQKLIHVIIADIDNFKNINDTLGHHMGDITLKNATKLLDSVFCEENYLTYRIGGDEFAVIALDLPTEKIEEKIENIKKLKISNDVDCTFSIGYSMADFSQQNAMENAFIRADRAMYKAKALIKRNI